MSYIRCLSNPESLYIWSDGKSVNISHHVPKPHSSGGFFAIPHGVFEGVCKKWVKTGGEPSFFRGAMVEEIHVYTKTGKIVPDMKPCKKGCVIETPNSWRPCAKCLNKQLQDRRREEFKIRLSYGSHFIHLWSVTWAYVISRFKKG